MVGIKVDITSRKQTELQLKEQGRELAHIDRLSMVGELSVAIAHELNQPLAAILRPTSARPGASCRTTRPTSPRFVKSSRPSGRITAARRTSFARSARSSAGTISRAPPCS